jgi:3-deoxy-manno-octulosonate cytidylyltransferase (CMP-KDO synthetase)
MPRALGVIPARYASTRFPGKPLASLAGRSMLERVWRAASAARRLERVIVATEDQRIVEAARSFGADAMLTSAEHLSGTDRVAEVARRLGAGNGAGNVVGKDVHDVILNIQGDEPLVTPSSLDRLVAAFDGDPVPALATLVEPLGTVEELFDPNVVKVVADGAGRALYFSRSPIPFHRGASPRLAADFREALARRPGGLAGYLKHQGLYAYSRSALERLAALPPAPLELDEGLEQLRALADGMVVRLVDSDFRSQAVDTPADLERVTRSIAEAP